jgi:hypothetical protein
MRVVLGLLGGALILALLGGFFVWGRSPEGEGACRGCGRHRGELSGPSLRTLSSAQADYRGNDRDGNGVHDFWRGDVAGLYGLLPTGSSEMIKLIELSVAGADAAPVGAARPGAVGPGVVASNQYCVSAPKAGYWVRAIRHADERVPDPQRFAYCSYPDDYPRHGRFTFVIDEHNVIFRKDLGHGRGLDVLPADLQKDGWTPLD